MNKILSTLFLVMLMGHIGSAQIVTSSCSAPDSIKALYQDDADRLALRKTFDDNSAWKDSINLDTILSNNILGALLAVHNADSLAARDTLVKLNIHNNPRPTLKITTVVVDTILSWARELEKGNLTQTGNDTVNDLITKYKLSVQSFDKFLDTTFLVNLKSVDNLNIAILSGKFSVIHGVYFAHPKGIHGDGSTIDISFNNQFALLTFSHGWTDCRISCWYRRFWQFRVYLNNCSVQYLGSYGDVLPQNVLSLQSEKRKEIKVFPNPFTTAVEVEGVGEGTEYRIFSIAGATVKQGRVANGKISELEKLLPGIYFLELQSGLGDQKYKLVKKI